MLRPLYDRTLALAGHRRAEPALAIVSFVESSVFPVPPDVMIVPMVLARPGRAWRIAAIATIASVLGGLLGYAIGATLFDTVGQWILSIFGGGNGFAAFQAYYAVWGLWFVVGAALTPFPYKIITIASGALALDPVLFTIASVAGRGLRFFAEAALLRYAGPPARRFVERRLGTVTAIAFAVVLALIIVWRLV
ncbi:MAG: YqaA family protein [Alphaproteobacteria bacterium]